ncbi:MAG: right-handed parallel beta-helix repeat-containing protein [Candidatus Eisenbacteria bacterium]|nr:right-handed parallel beta-helix repeat-containing protein [Candidatus Eisenbacteria bacterium]
MRSFDELGRAGLVVCAIVALAIVQLAVSPAVAELARVPSPEEEARLEEIRAAIEGRGAHWTADHTTMSGLSREELARRCGGGRPPYVQAILDTLRPDPEVFERTYPEYWDWREMGGVTPVKNQGGCGSCWDFAAVGATEGNLRIQEGVVMDLSEQQGLDCNEGGSSCDGGWQGDVYHVFTDPGAVSETCMPYTAMEGDCRQRLCEKVAIIDGYQYISGNVEAYKAALMEGPISTCYTVYEDFDAYSGGCYEHVWGSYVAGHCITIVGWDDSMCGGSGAWICKNSWGGTWGVAGYFYIKYGDSGIGWGAERPLNAHLPRVRLVPDEFATIQSAITAAERADVIKVAAGTYAGNITIPDYVSLYGGYNSDFTTRDPELYPTIIDAGGSGNVITCEGRDNIVIDGFEIRNSGATSYGVYVRNSGIKIRDCDIHDAWRGIGLVYGSGESTDDIALIDFCEIHGNTGAGVFINDPNNPDVGMFYTAVYDNGGLGVYSYAADTDIGNCTIAFNASDGVDIRSSTGNTFSMNIIAENEGAGVRATSCTPTFLANDVWSNTAGDYVGCVAGPGDMSVDPIFCDGPGDVSVHASSPTLAYDMGAMGIGCPEGPQNLAVAQDGASLGLSWDVPPARVEVDYYVVYRDTARVPLTAIATVYPPTTSYTDIAIPACEMSYYWVSAVDTAGIEGAPSNRVEAELCYDGPYNLSVTFGEGANELSWVAGDGPIDGYIIERGNVSAPPESVGWVSSGTLEFVDLTTENCPRDNYEYEIVPVYDTGWKGEHSDPVSVDPSPSAPAGITAEWVGSDIELTWDDNCESDFRRYWVYRDTVPFSPPINSELLVGFTPDPYHLDEGLDPGFTYFYRLVATDAEAQKSRYSDMIYVGTGDLLTVPSPYGTIQAAIDAASAIDTVVVSPGTYNEHITMKNGVIVQSAAGPGSTTISYGSGSVVSSTGGDCDLTLLRGFTIDGQGSATNGLDFWSSYMRVEDCTVTNCSTGANFKYGGSPAIAGNHLTSNSNGISVADSSAPFLSGNVIDFNTFSGIYNTGVPGPRVGQGLEDANDIMENAYFQVFNLGSEPVDADYNYWGGPCAGDSLFYGVVDYVPWTDATHTETYTECGTGVEEGSVSSRAYLGQAVPNPFNPTTTIRYRVPSGGGPVRLTVYDLTGREVRVLVDGTQSGGEHAVVWRGRDGSGREVGSGVYFYRLEASGTTFERKMVLLK